MLSCLFLTFPLQAIALPRWGMPSRRAQVLAFLDVATLVSLRAVDSARLSWDAAADAAWQRACRDARAVLSPRYAEAGQERLDQRDAMRRRDMILSG